MTDHNNHIRQYTLADIEHYLQGKLSPAEMHALEKAALNDPLLADAIEGFRESDFGIAENDLSDVRNRLLQETKTKRIIPWLRIAAMFVLLAGVGSFSWYLMNNTSDQQELAPLNVAVVSPETSKAFAPAQDTVTAKKLPETAPPAIAGKKAGDLAVRSETYKNRIQPETELAMLRSKTIAARSAEQEAANRETLTALNDKTALQRSVVAANANSTGIGQLSNLTVSGTIQAGTLSGTISETALNSITSLGNLSNLTVTGTVTGATVTNRDALSEVVITGYRATSKKEAAGSTQSVKPAEIREISPANGWQSFTSYLAEKIDSVRIRNTGSVFTGTIEAELTLNRKGKVKDVTILSTFNTSLNELIIRSIKDGPDWLLANGKAAPGKKKIVITL